MKILLYTDNHFCENSSIIRKQGSTFSMRLENQIAAVNWAEQTALDNNCRMIVCLGDFFDKPILNDQELTALKEIKWAEIPHYFIVGNHESTINGLKYSSAKVLENDYSIIVNQPETTLINNCEICFLPYIIERDRKSINDYFGPQTTKRIILSHNDLKGIQMGPVKSTTGFEVDDIENNCDLFINGHLHNGIAITNKIINLGNLTGKDFSEDASIYSHKAAILDTDTLQLEYIENPVAFNFYKVVITTEADIKKCYSFKSNSFVSVKVINSLVNKVKELLTANSNVLDFRLILEQEQSNKADDQKSEIDFTVDYLKKFIDCCYAKLEKTKALDEELSEVCRR